MGDRDAEAVALNNLSIVLAQSGDAAAATEAARAGAELALRIGSSDLPRVLSNLAETEGTLGLLADAERHYRDGLELARLHGNRIAQPWLRAALAMSAFEQGSWDEAVHGARAREASGDVHYLDAALSLVEAEIVLAREGRLLAGSVSDALDAARAIGDVQLLVPVLARGAFLLSVAGEVAQAERWLGECVDASTGDVSCPPDPWCVVLVLAWLDVVGGVVPEVFLRGPDVPGPRRPRPCATTAPARPPTCSRPSGR